MNYIDTVNWMFHQLPMYQNKGRSAYKANLNNTILLAKHLDNPENKFKSVHVAGTNGKGSTSHMLASILQEAGYSVGLYTSPHLKDFRERIKIDGNCISKQFVIQFIKQNKLFFEANALSFFEMTVGLAFEYFAKQNVNIAIIEVGLGGRLDSTNIISPEVSVITNIGLDHTQFLGHTIQDIAKEKGGVIKPNIPVVIGETQSETKPLFMDIARGQNSSIYFADALVKIDYESDLKGTYQTHNVKTAVQSIYELNKKGFSVSDEDIAKGLLNVIKNTGIKGRWQILQSSPNIICDIAHNKEGLTYVMQQLKKEPYNNLHMVLGMVNDKNIDAMIDLFPKEATYYFCRPNILRGLDANILKDVFTKNGYHGNDYNSVAEALKNAKNNANKSDVIYVGGSTFVVAEII